jgi:hypothetical protein
VQPKWIPHEQNPKVVKWDSNIRGKRWYYDVIQNKYYYIIEDRTDVTEIVEDNEYHDFDFEEKAFSEDFGVLEYMTPQQRLEYLLAVYDPNGDSDLLYAAAGILLSGGTGKLYQQANPMLVSVYRGYLDKGKTKYDALNNATWRSLVPEIQHLKETTKLDSTDNILEKGANIGSFVIYFTKRVEQADKPKADPSFGMLHKLSKFLNNPVALKDFILKDMEPDFTAALKAKHQSEGEGSYFNHGSYVEDGRHIPEYSKSIAESLRNSDGNGKILEYSKAIVRSWQALISRRIIIIFDKPGVPGVYGQTPGIEAKSSDALMNTNLENFTGLPAEPLTLINLENEPLEIFKTIVHELAHAIGFNPTDHGDTGHMGTTSEYAEEEKTYGPKLLFDAYYFETLAERIIKA